MSHLSMFIADSTARTRERRGSAQVGGASPRMHTYTRNYSCTSLGIRIFSGCLNLP